MPLPAPSHLLVEVFSFLLAAGATADAARRGPRPLATLLAAMGFGLVVELHFLTGYDGYHYGDFLVEVTVGGATMPLWVAAGWGAILYAVMRATDRMGLPWTRRPALDALLAVSLDLSIEEAARSQGWWSFAQPGRLVAAPLDNYIGWTLITGSFSLAVRGGFRLFRGRSALVALGVPVAAFVLASLFMVGARVIWGHVLVPLGAELPTLLTMVAVLGAVSLPAARRAARAGPRPWLSTVTPVGIHGVCLGSTLLAGGPGGDLVASLPFLAVAALSLLAFRYPPTRRLKPSRTRTEGPEPPSGA